MAGKRFSAEQIIIKLREAEVGLAQGQRVGQVSKQMGVSEQTYYRWRKEYGGLRLDQAKRLKVLGKENTLMNLQKPVNRLFSKAYVILGSFTRRCRLLSPSILRPFRIPIQVVEATNLWINQPDQNRTPGTSAPRDLVPCTAWERFSSSSSSSKKRSTPRNSSTVKSSPGSCPNSSKPKTDLPPRVVPPSQSESGSTVCMPLPVYFSV